MLQRSVLFIRTNLKISKREYSLSLQTVLSLSFFDYPFQIRKSLLLSLFRQHTQKLFQYFLCMWMKKPG